MKATVMYGAGDVRIENVADASIVNPTDALVRVTRACICGSDLWPYKDLKPDDPPPYKRNMDPASCRTRWKAALTGRFTRSSSPGP